MSITRALASAVSGLTASARGTETVASNLSNIMTPGYARREMNLVDDRLGGVRVDGIQRMVNLTLGAEARIATSAQAYSQVRADFLQGMERLMGLPGEPGSIGSAFGEFQAALTAATARPDDNIRLSHLVATASSLGSKLNAIGDGIQAARLGAEQQIASDVNTLNEGLARVAELNKRIIALRGAGVEIASLEDERQTVVDRIAAIVPIRQVEREGGKVALFTTGGAVLLDGTEPMSIAFQPRSIIDAGLSIEGGTLGTLIYDGDPIPPERMSFFAGGSISAAFAIRDELAPTLQREVDAIALDLCDRFADPALDPTLAGQPGLFTDAGAAADLSTIAGLASRIEINAAVSPSAGGDLWRLRTGIGAAAPGPVGDSSLLLRMSNMLTASRSMTDSASFPGSYSMDSFVGQLASRVSTRRVGGDSELAASNARATALNTGLLAEGVDSDDEMRRLLQYEQAYSANAKVIQTIDEMMNAILRI